MKPIGFYTSVMPQDGSYLNSLQEEYGSTFEKMPRTLKAALLLEIAENLYVVEEKMAGCFTATWGTDLAKQEAIAEEIYRRVTINEQMGLAEAIINQLKQPRGQQWIDKT